MKITLKCLSICILLSIATCVALAQNLDNKSTRPKSSVSTPRVICQGETIPKTLVVVGYKVSAKCGNRSELVLKRPGNNGVVCADSPIPDGFRALGLQGSVPCTTTDSNPLTNAILIESDNLVTAPQPLPDSRNATRTARTPDRDVDDEDIPRPTERQTRPKVEKSSSSESESPLPSREEIEIAVRRTTVMIGMTMQDVSRAWGKSHTTDSLIENDGLIHIWGYRRGKVYFRNGIVYRILLLKG